MTHLVQMYCHVEVEEAQDVAVKTAKLHLERNGVDPDTIEVHTESDGERIRIRVTGETRDQ